jgi:hypothetical protein
MRNARFIVPAFVAALISACSHQGGYQSGSASGPISYNLLQVDGDQTRIGINGPATAAGISVPKNEQIIVLKGEPLASFKDATGKEQGNLGTTDTVVQVTGRLPEPGRESPLIFRLIALSLAGSLTDAEGNQWRVKISLSERRGQPPSNAVARNKAYTQGDAQGTFDSELLMYPRFVFTRGGVEKVVDDPDRLSVKFTAHDAEWSSVPPRDAVRPEMSGRFFALRAKHGGEAGQHATKPATTRAIAVSASH